MNAEQIILTRLLGKYEKSKHLLEPGSSKRRVMLRIDRKELPEYKIDEDAGLRDMYNAAAQNLEKQQLVQLVWLNGRPVLSEIVLNLASVEQAYIQAGRFHPRVLAEQAVALLEKYIGNASTSWICTWRDAVKHDAESKFKLPSYVGNHLDFLEKLLQAMALYDALCGHSITMRAFSSKCYQDTKYFEREVRDVFLRIACEYNRELKDACANSTLGVRQQLAFLNIYARPELYELCGNVSINTEKGQLDVNACCPYGIALPSTLVEHIEHFDLQHIKSITFIENKTNYDEYLLSEKQTDELVLYQGGFVSPQQRKLFGKIADDMNTSFVKEVRFWADIDLGGIKMYYQLKSIFPQLQPMRMDAEVVEQYSASGLLRDESYWNEMQSALDRDLYPMFKDTMQALLKYRVTIEQECFLKSV